MAESEFKLSLIIRAFDRATAPLRALNARIGAMTAPLRRINNGMRAMAEAAGVPLLVSGFARVGGAVRGVIRETVALGVRLGLMTGAAVAGFAAITRASTSAGDQLAKAADRVGMSVNAFAELQHAAQMSGVDPGEWASEMDQFVKRLGDAKRGTGDLFSTLSEVSPALLQQLIAADGPEEAINLMFRAISRLDDPTKKASIAASAFGRSGLKLIPLLKDGVDGVEALREEYRRLHGDAEQWARRSEEFEDAWERITTAFRGTRDAVVTALIPALLPLMDRLSSWLGENRGQVQAWAEAFAGELPGRLERLAAGFADVWGSVQPFIAGARELIEQFGGIKAVAVALGLYLGSGLIGALYTLTTAVAALGAVILTTPIGWILAGLAAIAAGALLVVRNWDKIKAALGRLADWIDARWTALTEGIAAAINAMIPGWLRDRLAKGGISFGGGALGAGPSGPPLNAGAALPRANLLAGKPQQAHVIVDFSNLPRGTRIKEKAGGTADVELLRGYAMAEAY